MMSARKLRYGDLPVKEHICCFEGEIFVMIFRVEIGSGRSWRGQALPSGECPVETSQVEQLTKEILMTTLHECNEGTDEQQ